MIELDWLSGQDALFLQVEAPNQPMHVGGLAIFEGAPFYDETGEFRLEDVQEAIAARLHLVPRFRRKLHHIPFDPSHRVWVDDPDFDVANHVRCERLPEPGGWDELRHFIQHVEAVPLDRDLPLWELWFVEGLAEGRPAHPDLKNAESLMPCTVHNIQGIAHKSSDGVSMVFPDVCNLPAPPGPPVPIPYPNIGKSSDTVSGTTTVKADGSMVMVKGAKYMMSAGDEPGTVGGVMSGTFKQECEFLMYSFNVMLDGKNVCRMGAPLWHNKKNICG